MKKLVAPHAPEGKVYSLVVENIPQLSRALEKEPEEIRYTDANDVTIYNYTYHLQRKRGEQTVGVLVLSIQLSDDQENRGEINISDMKVNQPVRRESLVAATQFSISDERIVFYEDTKRLAISYDYEVTVSHS